MMNICVFSPLPTTRLLQGRYSCLSRYLGTSLEDNVVSIFMQFVPGGSIANVLARFGALVEEVFCSYTKQILEGVEYLHNNNVIHRSVVSHSFSQSLLYM